MTGISADYWQGVFRWLAGRIVLRGVKLGIALVTLLLLALSVWGNTQLRQEFNPVWFLPAESYLAQWHKYNQHYFPSQVVYIKIFLFSFNGVIRIGFQCQPG